MNKFEKSIIRFSSRKEKKALKNHPCKKTRRGRYIINVMDSYYDYGGVGIGYYNGCEIYQHTEGYEHPKGDFFKALIKGTTPWRFNGNKYKENNCEKFEFNLFDCL